MIKQILEKAITNGASDIILSPNREVSYKINGDVTFIEDFGIMKIEKLNNIFLQITTKNQQITFTNTKELDFGISFGDRRFRINAFGVKGGFGLVFRIIAGNIPAFNSLGLADSIKNLINKKNGIVLITGSVGSGKTTTLASLLNEINLNTSKHIITIEDPIEFVYPEGKSLIEQREVGANTLSFDNGLKYALRQAPDVILVGEMRDLDTFRLALRAAETGNLVFATLHTSGAARTIARIIDMFPVGEKEQIRAQLSESLIGVVWQKLLKRKDGKGRVVATEVLLNTVGVSNIIRKGETHKLDSIIETSKNEGMIQMKDSLSDLYSRGIVSEDVK